MMNTRWISSQTAVQMTNKKTLFNVTDVFHGNTPNAKKSTNRVLRRKINMFATLADFLKMSESQSRFVIVYLINEFKVCPQLLKLILRV